MDTSYLDMKLDIKKYPRQKRGLRIEMLLEEFEAGFTERVAQATSEMLGWTNDTVVDTQVLREHGPDIEAIGAIEKLRYVSDLAWEFLGEILMDGERWLVVSPLRFVDEAIDQEARRYTFEVQCSLMSPRRFGKHLQDLLPTFTVEDLIWEDQEDFPTSEIKDMHRVIGVDHITPQLAQDIWGESGTVENFEVVTKFILEENRVEHDLHNILFSVWLDVVGDYLEEDYEEYLLDDIADNRLYSYVIANMLVDHMVEVFDIRCSSEDLDNHPVVRDFYEYQYKDDSEAFDIFVRKPIRLEKLYRFLLEQNSDLASGDS